MQTCVGLVPPNAPLPSRSHEIVLNSSDAATPLGIHHLLAVCNRHQLPTGQVKRVERRALKLQHRREHLQTTRNAAVGVAVSMALCASQLAQHAIRGGEQHWRHCVAALGRWFKGIKLHLWT